jgi:hypothetical protein
LAMPALRKLDSDERAGLQAAVGDLIRADRKVSLFELAMSSFLNRHLAADSQRVVPVTHRNYKAVLPALRVLMSLLARAGAENGHGAEALYQQAMAGFASSEGESQLAPRVSLKELQEALHTLNRLSPLLKPAVIDACGHCVTHDGRVDTAEYELMRLVADQLDCPMPPLAA